MKNLLLIPLLFSLVISNCQAQTNVNDLEGTWKIENKENYEAWKKGQDGNLIGESYKLINGNKAVSETLVINTDNDQTVYEATVPNQNEGKTVSFTLNMENTEALSFENPAHDFPTKIIYQFETQNRLFVQVQGADGKGFSFYMDRQ